VALARDGDHDAFSQLVTASAGRLYAIASLIIRDRESAADAVQDALVGAWRDIRSLRDPDRFDAWLHRLLVRACYRHARMHRRRHVVELRALPVPEPAVASGELSTVQRDEIERGLRRLAPEQRAVLVLHHYLGLPLWEVAEALDIPIGTAKSRLNRATAAMRASLQADAREPVAAEGRTA
jgi:RNA polymerase sigma-70 factor (ECF subfamily)